MDASSQGGSLADNACHYYSDSPFDFGLDEGGIAHRGLVLVNEADSRTLSLAKPSPSGFLTGHTMGRPFLQYIDEVNTPKYCCAKCGLDIASSTHIIWEGYMAAQQPAYLFRATINVDPSSAVRSESLSTGKYTLVDVQCRKCSIPLGWRYVTAERNDQKYKEGCTLLQQELLRRVNCLKYTTQCTAITPFRRSSDIPPPPPPRRR